ncbi:Outer membrane scaffolding protein for murein synthesis, MipA/OmpV family [Marinobacter daqiaonensis]|uniref:Outer membrane scaffolding protein for murein synthesis, MipA/OmpV family n=1 Tax=Marinobacter daqiaonensis TaxID=650891 RepID=A0A1I6GK00_9GAMM|nr:MipA/OmpV family protein [Marinobacter daqiaonensis]SFR42508.1 Outer membrane scaffolding protein for murein synthesis, MipA/OmpV family [Marinobacter daqiaonensis]
MKNTVLQVATFLGALSCLGSSNAAETRTALVPLPSIGDFTDGDGWGVGLGLGVEYETAYEGSDEFEFEIDPAGGVQWRTGEHIFFWAGEAIGWRTLAKDAWLFQATVGYEEGREEDDSEDGRLDGLGESSSGVILLLEVRRALADDWRYFLDGRVLTGEIGTLGILGAGTCLACEADGTGWEVGAAVTFHDGELANRDFGVNARQSIDSGLPETDVDSGYRSTGVNVNYRNYLNENWQIFGEALYEVYGSDVSDSPISRNDYEAEIGVGFIYVF